VRLGLAIAIVLVAPAPAAADAECLPAADLAGDADIAAEVARALSLLGVVHGEVEGACPAVTATVLRDEAGIAVTVRDERGRIEGRVVADPRTAAAWIESWVGDDAAPLWSATPVVARPAPEPAPTETALVTPPSAAPVEDEVAAETTVPPHPWSRWLPSVAVHLGRDLASDGSTWDGVGVAGCVRLGALCVGAAGRHVVNGAFSNTGGLTSYDRSATVLAATAAYRLRIARVVVAPELSAGVGWTTTRRDEPAEPCFNPDGTLCDGAIYVGDGFGARTVAPRVGAALTLAVPLTDWMFLDGRLGAEAAPGAHVAPHRPGEANPTDPSSPIPPGDPLLDLPGEPGWAWTAAVGLRAEVP
jgi:hypothetical protein